MEARPDRVDVYILRSEGEVLNRGWLLISLQLSAKQLSCLSLLFATSAEGLAHSVHLQAGWKTICITKFENRTAWWLSKVGSVFSHAPDFFFFKSVLLYHCIACWSEAEEQLIYCSELMLHEHKSYGPGGVGSTFKEILKCTYREAEWVSPHYSLRKVSGARLSSYECFLFVKAWW